MTEQEQQQFILDHIRNNPDSIPQVKEIIKAFLEPVSS